MLRDNKACILIKYKADSPCIHKGTKKTELYIVDHMIIATKEESGAISQYHMYKN